MYMELLPEIDLSEQETLTGKRAYFPLGSGPVEAGMEAAGIVGELLERGYIVVPFPPDMWIAKYDNIRLTLRVVDSQPALN